MNDLTRALHYTQDLRKRKQPDAMSINQADMVAMLAEIERLRLIESAVSTLLCLHSDDDGDTIVSAELMRELREAVFHD